MIAKLPLVPFVIMNLTRLTAGVCMEFEIQVQGNQRSSRRFATRLHRFAVLSRLKKKISGTRVRVDPARV